MQFFEFHKGNLVAINYEMGHTLQQAVNRRLPKMAIRVQSQFRSRGIFGGQSEAGFPQLLRFPLLHIH
jgi:hypothetical protein